MNHSERNHELTSMLSRLIASQDLERRETEWLFGRLMDGEIGEPIKAALLVALAAKGETASEIVGAVQAMRARSIALDSKRASLVDTCGTGGDRKGTFNVSTAAALVAAAAGVPVAKHGNRSVSSRSGSADVLEALGVRIDVEPAVSVRMLDEIGIAFLFAPQFHPAMREVAEVRRTLGVRTIFNILGPLTNPAGAQRQVIGVYADALVEKVAHVLLELGHEHALVVRGRDGLDELTTTGPTLVAEVKGGTFDTEELDPRDYGLDLARDEELLGGDPRTNAEQIQRVLEGQAGPLRDITILNAGAAIYVGGEAPDLRAGMAVAEEALRDGRALAKLHALRSFPISPS